MYHVNWPDVITNDALSTIGKIASLDALDDTFHLKERIATVLAHSGGLPITPDDWSEPEHTAICLQLLHEATGAVLRNGLGLRAPLAGCNLNYSDSTTITRQLSTASRIDANQADEAQLEPLPVIGPSLAKRIVRERRQNGPFSSGKELADRVSGIGKSGSQRLDLILHYGTPGTSPGINDSRLYRGIFEHDFRTLIELQHEEKPEQKLLGALETLVTFTAAKPHPDTLANRIRSELSCNSTTVQARFVPADSIEILEDKSYYHRLQDFLGHAKNRIDIAMFFISFPGQSHPNHALLTRLAEAHKRGVKVRVLVDKDRDEDPYGSRIINYNAIEFLHRHGIEVKTDKEDQLLHSKFVLIDDNISIIGSHNWTAGSYFKYHDTSVAINSHILTDSMRKRYKTMWDDGTTPDFQ